MNKLDEHLDRIQQEVALMIGISAASLLMTAYKTYKDYLTKAARQCSGLPPKEKAICMVRAKMHASNVQLQTVKGSMAKCAKTKDPEKCKIKLGNKVKVLAMRVRENAKRLKELKSQGYSK